MGCLMTISNANNLIDFDKYGIGEISNKDKRVIAEYLINGNNQTRAWMEVYPKCSYTTARVKASQFFAKDNIKLAVSTYLENIFGGKTNDLKDLIFNQHKRILEIEATDLFYDNGEAKPLKEIPFDVRQLIQGVEVKVYGKDANVEKLVYTIPDKNKSRDFLAKYIRMIDDTKKIDLTSNGKDIGVLAVPQGMTVDEWINKEKEDREE